MCSPPLWFQGLNEEEIQGFHVEVDQTRLLWCARVQLHGYRVELQCLHTGNLHNVAFRPTHLPLGCNWLFAARDISELVLTHFRLGLPSQQEGGASVPLQMGLTGVRVRVR